MNSLHSLRTEWRSEWQIPQNRISIWTPCSVGSRRAIVVEASGDVALVAEYAFVLCIICAPVIFLYGPESGLVLLVADVLLLRVVAQRPVICSSLSGYRAPCTHSPSARPSIWRASAL